MPSNPVLPYPGKSQSIPQSLTLDAVASVGGGRPGSQPHHHGRQHGALAAPVLALDEGDPAVEVQFQVLVAHEVLQGDVTDEAGRLRLRDGDVYCSLTCIRQRLEHPIIDEALRVKK